MSTTVSALRKIPVEDIVEKLGGEFVESGRSLRYTSPFRDEKKGSFYVYTDNNKWHDFGHVGKKSGDGLDLICEYLSEKSQPHTPKDGLAFAEKLLAGLEINRPHHRRKLTTGNSNKIVIDQVRDQLSPSTLNYVKGRGIFSMGIIRNHLKQVHFHFNKTPEKRWYASGFPSDKEGFEIRGRVGDFQIKYAHGKKAVSSFQGSSPKGEVNIFEGFFDYLTHLQREGISTPETDTIVLNSNNMVNQAIAQIKDKGYQSINLYKQNDAPGTKVLAALQEAFPNMKINDMSIQYKGFNDYNEFHQHTHHATPQKTAG